MENISIRTSTREEMIDITAEVQAVLDKKTVQSSLVTVYTPHTTTAITINEGADPAVVRDILVYLRGLVPPVPQTGDYQHKEGNSDAHIKSSLLGCSQTLPVENGTLQLGTWQRVFFCEFDGPRSRTIRVSAAGW